VTNEAEADRQRKPQKWSTRVANALARRLDEECEACVERRKASDHPEQIPEYPKCIPECGRQHEEREALSGAPPGDGIVGSPSTVWARTRVEAAAQADALAKELDRVKRLEIELHGRLATECEECKSRNADSGNESDRLPYPKCVAGCERQAAARAALGEGSP
jgi:hypothetical protein